jgi:type II secretory pathway component GspD/PulD (secretin)
LQQFGNTRITSKTVSTTINSVPTYGISSLEKDYISDLSQTQSGSISNYNTVSTSKATAVDGLSFHMFPRINPDGKIVLTIQPKLSKHLGLEPFSPTPESYIQNETRNQKEFTSTVILEDGGVAIIAGITSDSEVKDKQGLPLLTNEIDSFGDFIGGNRSKNKTHSEIVVFVTTNISK